MPTPANMAGLGAPASSFAAARTKPAQLQACVADRFYRVDICPIVQHVLRHLNQYWSRPASLCASERFSDARANFADVHGTCAESHRPLKDVELSA
jgi:hypothetical protein